MKVNSNKRYEVKFWAIECPNCEEQIELDSKYQTDIICPFCDADIEITEE